MRGQVVRHIGSAALKLEGPHLGINPWLAITGVRPGAENCELLWNEKSPKQLIYLGFFDFSLIAEQKKTNKLLEAAAERNKLPTDVVLVSTRKQA